MRSATICPPKATNLDRTTKQNTTRYTIGDQADRRRAGLVLPVPWGARDNLCARSVSGSRERRVDDLCSGDDTQTRTQLTTRRGGLIYI